VAVRHAQEAVQVLALKANIYEKTWIELVAIEK
jgi:hypothetical protein